MTLEAAATLAQMTIAKTSLNKLSATRFTAFDSLRSLLLKYVKIIDGSIAELVRECPVLEDLTLDSCNIPKAFLVSTEDIMIKRLAVLYTDTKDRLDIDISTPYLLKLEIVEVNALSVSIRNASQLVDATLSIVLLVNKPGVVRGDPFNSMLAGLRHCRGLTLNTYMPWMLHTDPYLPEELQTPLENLNDLIMVAGLLQIELDRVSFLLRSCPNLEVLIISLHEPWPMGSVIDETSTAYRIEEDGHWETQTKPFPCLLHSLRRITVMKLKGSTIELQMIKFLLTNAKVLEKMVIYLDEMREEASKTPQRTIICRQQRKNIRTFLRFVSTYFRDKVTVINPNKK
ncbi:hypothetical protein COLO4_09529 [Corchorus olitorius]|uniref:Rhodanese domain-containing protein n=1 Tax=Corchorus olitorius TaxID=93759 RepID=A0A1R3KBR2_9ROSI|nr:hypothetical protein COLO4_09529 [Corchorus olitorius]